MAKLTPAQMLELEKKKQQGGLSSSSSSSSMSSSSSSSSVPESSNSYGPNTTDMVKSSSTAPIKQDKPEPTPKKNPNKYKKNNTGGSSLTQYDNVIPWTTKYTPPQQEQADSATEVGDRDDWNVDWDDPFAQMAEPDEHRTVLQAMMNWNDVPYGQRWHHFIQHGFTGMHGQPFQELMQLVNAEGDPYGSSSTYGQELRAREQHRKLIAGQWDQLLDEWNSGRYASGDRYTVEKFFTEANRLRQQYAEAGYDPNELHRPSINAGGFQQGFQKDLQEDRKKLDWIGGWLNDIQRNVALDPNWLNRDQAMMYFDKLSEYTVTNWSQNKGAIADAEKIRTQVNSMPYADRQVYNKFMHMFFSANQVAQLEALSNANDRDARAILDSMYKFLNLSDKGDGAYGTVDKDGNVVLTNQARHYLDAALFGYKTLSGRGNNNPISIDTAVTSYKNAKDAFQQYVMQNGNVDRQMVWDSAVAQYNIHKDQYKRKLPQLGLLWGWDYRGPQVDKNFGEYLRAWQNRQPVDQVMQNAALTKGNPPPMRDDPLGKLGGGGGNSLTTNQNGHPDNAVWNQKYNAWVWRDKSGKLNYSRGY